MTNPAESSPFPRALRGSLQWASLGAGMGFIVALTLVACVAALDYVTGYETRLAILYLVPIALSTWTGGLKAGLVVVAAASLSWVMSFRSTHAYSQEIFFYWEGLAMFVVHVTIVWLLARLRTALRRADERFLRVLEELHAGVYVVDQDRGGLLYANRRLASVLNTAPSSLQASDLERRFGAALAGRAAASLPLDAPYAQAGFVSGEVRDPETGRWYLVQAGPLPWNANRRVSLKVITDISEQKHALSLKQQHREMLHRSARLAALTEIASTLAHEINQPLMAIASYTDACLRLLARSRADQTEVVTALEKCRRQAIRAGEMISRMREFIRSRHPRRRQCDVNSVVRQSLDLIDVQVEDAGVTVELALAEELPPTHADPTLLVQVAVNLLQNAIDAMQGCASRRRSCMVSTGRHTDGSILVSVADQGTGIPADSSDAIFRPFFTTKPEGLGLGLSICRSVVEAHGGRLWHTASPGGGCTFHFTVPPEQCA